MASNGGFWCPNLIDNIHVFLRRGIPDDDVLQYNYQFVRNIGYNLQYLEFLNYLLTEQELHETIRSQTRKSFVITGMAIVEAILWYLLRKHELQRMEEWAEIQSLQTKVFKEGNKEYKIVNRVMRKLDNPVEPEMSLDAMVKKVESKTLLGIGSQVYRDLNYLRKLRNRVHIHAVQHDGDTDWWVFKDREVQLMKKALYSVFTSELFKPGEEHQAIIAYLEVMESAEDIAKDIP